MTKRIWLSLAILAVILVTLSFNMTSCLMLGFGNDYATKDDVEEMINKGMNGNITVSSLGKEVTVTCSNNNTILKETEWFKANRTWPTNGV